MSTIRLTIAEQEFIQRVSEEVTSSNALQFDIPIQQMLPIIKKAAKFFFEWDDNATTTKYLLITNETIRKNLAPTLFSTVILPSGIEGITDIWRTNTPSISLTSLRKFEAWGSYGMMSSGGTTVSPQDSSMSSRVATMFEYSLYQQLTKRGVRFDYNKHSKEFVVLSDVGGSSVVIEAACHIPLESLFSSYWFEEYVIALCKVRLGRIVKTFDFNLVGDVKIDQSIIDEGKEEKKEIEEHLRNTNAPATSRR